MEEEKVFARLIRLAKILRSEEGCPWDRAQDGASLANYVVREARELSEAVAAGETGNTREEIGDVLFTLISMAVLAEERGDFSLLNVLEDIEAKIVRRHPHVFGELSAKSVEDACRYWNEAKRSEKSDHRTTEGEQAQ